MNPDEGAAIFWMVVGAICICVALYSLMGWWFVLLAIGVFFLSAGWGA